VEYRGKLGEQPEVEAAPVLHRAEPAVRGGEAAVLEPGHDILLGQAKRQAPGPQPLGTDPVPLMGGVGLRRTHTWTPLSGDDISVLGPARSVNYQPRPDHADCPPPGVRKEYDKVSRRRTCMPSPPTGHRVAHVVRTVPAERVPGGHRAHSHRGASPVRPGPAPRASLFAPGSSISASTSTGS